MSAGRKKSVQAGSCKEGFKVGQSQHRYSGAYNTDSLCSADTVTLSTYCSAQDVLIYRWNNFRAQRRVHHR